MRERPAVVFDTDVYVNALVGPDSDWTRLSSLTASANPDADCLSMAFDASGMRVMISPRILSSVSNALRRLGVNAANTKAAVTAVLDVVKASGGRVVDPPGHRYDPPHPKAMIMDLALEVDATLIVTDDADLSSPWYGIPVLRLRPLYLPRPSWGR
ncbi:MAG: hypothetical protein FWF02_00655 [Micrococcales bacterium]|nr:hypothetical protein [Micrococcales bacterium]MCL2666208.1 hypothetical protein [Micrococcales bacterium]